MDTTEERGRHKRDEPAHTRNAHVRHMTSIIDLAQVHGALPKAARYRPPSHAPGDSRPMFLWGAVGRIAALHLVVWGTLGHAGSRDSQGRKSGVPSGSAGVFCWPPRINASEQKSTGVGCSVPSFGPKGCVFLPAQFLQR